MLRILAAIATPVFLLAFTLPTFAGTTGGLGGRVVDTATKSPVAGAVVEVSSPSGSATTLSDARGLYTFVSLAPDTYTLRASHDGYDQFAETGVTIQADVHQTFDVALVPGTHVLGHVTIIDSGLVRPGQTIDLYSINATAAKTAQPLAGPGGVDQAYSALAIVPGLYVPQGQQGWYQPIYIRGGDQDQIGYELDGVPVNRSYDNAPESLLSNVGQQELQVYTGGATASSDGQGISGYINQIVKTGSHTPFGSMTYGLGSPIGYQKGAFEYGSASHDGRLTYYLAGSIADQFYRYVDQYNGVSLNNSGFFFPSFQFTGSGPIDLPGITLGASETRDHEAIANFHYAIPHANDRGSDDVQLLYINSDLHTFTYGSFNDFGGMATFGNVFAYPDQYVYTGQIGAALNPSAVTQYLYPDTPDTGRAFQSLVNPKLRAVADNAFSLLKLQYQHNIGTHAYFRALGFSTYSDWYIADPVPVPATLQYILPEITYGGVFSYVNQISDRQLLTVSASVASSREYRYSTGFNFLLGGGTTASGAIGGNFLGSVLVGSFTDGTHCYDQTLGTYTSCFASASQTSLNLNTGAITIPPPPPGGSPAALNSAKWIATESAYGGLINQVSPILTAGAISDRVRPNDKLTLDVGARVERYYDRLVNEANGYPARPFWFNAWNNEFCVAAAHLTLVARAIDPNTGVASACPAGSGPIQLSLGNNSAESNSVFEPRLAATYTLSADSTLRASYGTYARPPNASWVQYGVVQQDLATPMAQKFIAYGFTSPQHNLSPDISHNVDLSWEQHIAGTDVSFKFTPYYRGTLGQFENILLDANGNQSGVNIGSERSLGFEFALQKGDFSRDGFSGLIAFTYNKSRFYYARFASGFSAIDLINKQISQYNAYTQACAPGGSSANASQFGAPVCGSTSTGAAGAACFTPAGNPDPGCAAGDITNPYWTKSAQSLLDPGGAYVPYDVIPDQPLQAGNGFGPRLTATLIGQLKRGRFTATPSITYASGAYYGAPLSTIGNDPALNNNSTIPIPDDFTGVFDNMGAFQQPWRLTGNLSLGFAVTQRTTVTLAMTGLFDTCHQRGYAWDRAQYCTYTTLPFGVAPNSSTHVSAAGDPNYQFPYTVQNGNNNTQYVGTKIPFQAYLSFQVKL